MLWRDRQVGLGLECKLDFGVGAGGDLSDMQDVDDHVGAGVHARSVKPTLLSGAAFCCLRRLLEYSCRTYSRGVLIATRTYMYEYLHVQPQQQPSIALSPALIFLALWLVKATTWGRRPSAISRPLLKKKEVAFKVRTPHFTF